MIARQRIVFERQDAFGIQLAFAIFFLGTGSGLFILSTFYGFIWGKVADLVFLILGFVFLALDAGHPFRVWRAFSNPTTSWISRGVIAVSIFFVLAILAVLQGFGLLPWMDGSVGGWTVKILGLIVAIFLLIYTAMILASYPSVPAWNTGLLPVLFVSYGLTSGIAVLYFFHSLNTIPIIELAQIGFILVAVNLLLLLIYWVGLSSTVTAAKESTRLITKGELWPHFIIGVIVVGLVVPLIMVGQVYATSKVTGSSLILAGVLILIGNFIFRYVLLRMGTYEIPR